MGVAADSTAVYWTSESTPGVLLAYLSGGAGEPFFGGSPLGIAVDTMNLYWTDIELGTVNYFGFFSAGSPPPLATSQMSPTGLAVDANNVYWTTLSGPSGGGTVMATAIGGAGLVQPLATGQASPSALRPQMGTYTGRTSGRLPTTRMER